VNERKNVASVDGGPDSGEQPAHPAAPQPVQDIDGVPAGDHSRHHRGCLDRRVRARHAQHLTGGVVQAAAASSASSATSPADDTKFDRRNATDTFETV
jgi:hypothetical protein